MSTNDPAGTRGTTIVRSPADVLRLVVAVSSLLLVLLVEALFGGTIAGFIRDLLRGLDAIGEGVLTAIILVARVGSVALIVAALVVGIVMRPWRLLTTVVVAAIAGAGLFVIADALISSQRPPVATLSDVAGPLTSETFPSGVGVAIAAAAVTAAGPWLPRKFRRLAWIPVFALAVSAFIAAPISARSTAALLSGWAGGALVVVLLGAPVSRPPASAVIARLRSVGVDVVALKRASVDARGSTPYFGTTAGGGKLFVKVLGRDERDADLLFRLYRFVFKRGLGDLEPFSSLRRAVEHEALVSLSASTLGVRTPAVVGFSDVEPDGFVLAYAAVDGESFDRVAEGGITDEVLSRLWEQVVMLRKHRVAHRDLRLANLFLGRDGEVWMIDFGFAELAASELLLATDLAELVASLSLAVGADRAVAGAIAAVGADALASVEPRLRLKYLSGATRTALKERPGKLDEVRKRVTGPANRITESAPVLAESP